MIHLISTVEESRIEWLPQFVRHYLDLGVERFHLSVHFEPPQAAPFLAQRTEFARSLLAGFGIDLTMVLMCPYDSMMLRGHHDQLQSQLESESDWIVWADIDELQVYPEKLTALLDLAERDRIDYFGGVLIDRVTQDGSLAVFDPGRPIWEQFPRCCHITRDLAWACTEKVVCARSRVRLGGGNHGVLEEKSLKRYAGSVEVHHFKWDASVVPRLERRLAPDWRERCWWWVESQDFLDFIAGHGGKLELEVDPGGESAPG